MTDQKYGLELIGVSSIGGLLSLNKSSLDKKAFKNLHVFTVAIMDKKINRTVAFVRFDSKGSFVNGSVPEIGLSGETFSLAKDFFKVFHQSPFRLAFFSALSYLEKNGVHSFKSDNGSFDKGVSHKKQIRQRIIKHEKRWGRESSLYHSFGEFPRLSFNELKSILAANRPVPTKFLPPESILRKVRAKSYAALKLKKLGIKKYKALRKVRIARK